MNPVLNVTDIQRLLPHRFPFLLIDRVVSVEPGVRLVALKNVTMNEQFFAGHFPGNPIMPGVLIVEALAQAGGLLATYGKSFEPNAFLLFAGLDNVKFRRPVVPGDQLVLTVEAKRIRARSTHVHGVATVDGEVAVSCEMLSVLVHAEEDATVIDKWRAGTLVPADRDA